MRTNGLAEIRKACLGAVCALLLTCVGVPAASARQQNSTDDASAKKSSTPKATTNTTKHHKPASKSSAAGSSKGTKSTHSAPTASTGKSSSRKKKNARARGQQKIDSERAQAIQEALIREHYMSGEATGTWNQASEDAMRRYQADHGWQSKQVPDSRALIKLGLGPSNDHLLNPESAMTTGPDAPRASSLTPASQGPAPGNQAPASTPSQNESPDPQ